MQNDNAVDILIFIAYTECTEQKLHKSLCFEFTFLT